MVSSLMIPLTFTLILFPALVLGDAFDDLWSQYKQQSEAQQYESTTSRRERNLDHWDIPTAAAYLGLHPETLKPLPLHASESSSTETSAASAELTDEYVGHDAAILFYAQWCRNCHAAAPSWDAIATHLNAGSKPSNLVMALFDCEKTTRHTELCLAAGIKAYPTMMYVGSGEYHDTDLVSRSVLGEDKSAGPFGATTLRRTVKFQGNWQYGDQILDWVNIMKGLSSWHSVTESGPLSFLRNGMLNFITGGKSKKRAGKGKGGKEGMSDSLPVGVPPNFQTELRGSGVGGSGDSSASILAASAASAQEVKALETKLNATAKEKELYEKAVTHSSYLLDHMLFPESASPTRDPFTILTNSNGWHQNATTLPKDKPNDEHPSILRSCTLELTLDYCTRVTSRQTNLYLEELNAIPESDPFPSLEEIEARLLNDVKETEPYCGLIESCILGNYEEEECRSAECPFENKAACTYVGNCLDPDVQNEYGMALGLIAEGEKVLEQDWGVASAGDDKDANVGVGNTSSGASSDGGNAGAGVGGWGVPVN